MNTLKVTYENGQTSERQTRWSKQQCEDYYLETYFDINKDGNVLKCVKIDVVEHCAPLDQQYNELINYLNT
jgi:hypothetical protein